MAGCASDPARASLYDQKKFDIPYIRDFLLDRGAPGDVSETATTWSNLMPLYNAVTAAANRAFAELSVQGYVMCHLSHSYHAGACLYFTFAFGATTDDTMLGRVRGRQVRHPAGVRRQRRHVLASPCRRDRARPVAAEDISAPGVAMLGALFDGFDPGASSQPGQDRLVA